MPIEPGQFFCVSEGSVGFIEEALQGNKSQIVCGILRIQLESQIGWRNSMSYLVILALDIVRNEELIFLGRNGAEDAPGFQRHFAQEVLVVSGDFAASGSEGAVQPARDGLGE